MKTQNEENKHGFVLDTCTIINIMKNRSMADLLKCHLEMENCPVYLNSVALDEAAKKGYDKKNIISIIQNYLNTLVIVKDVSSEVHEEAEKLEQECSLIHHGDSAIAAFSKKNRSTLITFDKALLKGCLISGILAFSPSMLVSGAIAV